MSKIILRLRHYRRNLKLLDRGVNSFIRNYSDVDNTKEDVPKDGTFQQVRKGVLNEKKQSILEESFFHREEMDKLRELKKKINLEKEKKEEKSKKD